VGASVKKYAIVVAIGAVVLAAHAKAAEQNNWYLGVEGGVEFDGQFNELDETGEAFLVTVGRHFASDFAIESELGYRSTSEPNFFTPTNIDIDQLSVMVNVAYAAEVTKDLSFGLAVGAGLDRLTYNVPVGAGFGPLEADDLKAAVQLKISAEVALTDTIAATANYRVMHAFENDFSDIDNSTLTVGLKLAF
jgi:opacity protein-like surface antigen